MGLECLGEDILRNRTMISARNWRARPEDSPEAKVDAFSFSGAVFAAFRASLAASVSLGGARSLLVRGGAAHLAIDESAQNNYERRCIRLMNLP